MRKGIQWSKTKEEDVEKITIELVCGLQEKNGLMGFTTLVSKNLPIIIVHSNVVVNSDIYDGYIVHGTGKPDYDVFFEDIRMVARTKPCLYIYMYQVPSINGIVVARDACSWSELSTCFLETFGHLLDEKSKKKMDELFSD